MKKGTNSKESYLERLFSPNLIFVADPSSILKNYPKRSQKLEKKVFIDYAKDLNPAFIKNGKMYLLRGAKQGQETGFYSRLYASKGTIENQGLNPFNVAIAQSINGNTPFLSATTNLYTAASFSQFESIYVIEISVDDVYSFTKYEYLGEDEYLIPDFISKDEIIGSFKYNNFKQIFNFLRNVVGLDIIPEDLGLTLSELEKPNEEIINRGVSFNTSSGHLNFVLDAVRDFCLSSDVSLEYIAKNENRKK